MVRLSRLVEIKSNIEYNRFGSKIILTESEYNYLTQQAERVQELEEENRRYRKVINNINEKAMLFGTNEEVYEAIKEAIRVLEGEE